MDRIRGGTDKDAAVYYHVIGTSQRKRIQSSPSQHNDLDELAEDILVYQDREHPGWMFGTDISDDGEYLYLQIVKDTGKVGHFINPMTFINWTTRKTFCGLQRSTTIKSNLGCNGERSSTNIPPSIMCKENPLLP